MRLIGKIASEGFRSVHQNHYIAGHHKIPRIWILAADRHIARIFSKPDGHLEQIGEATPAGHQKYSSGYTAARMAALVASYIRRRMQSKSRNAKDFIKNLAEWLDDAVRNDAFDRLVIAASPKMLSDIRRVLSPKVQDRIIAQVDKDLTNMNERDLLDELKSIFWF